MTEKLYYKDKKTAEFNAEIIDVQAASRGWKVRMDQTFFYPESGGQPADKGWINGQPVVHVTEEGDNVFHYLADKVPLGKAKGKIDMAYRLDYMQQHTGQHIISACFWKVGKYKTVSVHMGEAYTTIDIDVSDISTEKVQEVEEMVNRVINRNLPVEIIVSDSKHVHRFPLRKPITVDGQIRLVHIKDLDYVGCCGLHLERTGEVGLAKSIGTEKIKGNIRTIWKIGKRAFRDYEFKIQTMAQFRNLLSTHEDTFVEKIQQLMGDVNRLNRKCNVTENRLVEQVVAELVERHAHTNDQGITVITRAFKNEDNQLIIKIAKKIIARKNTVFCITNREGKKILWIIGCWEKIDLPFHMIRDELLKIIQGKGGGRHPLWQGIGGKPEAVDQFLSAFKEGIFTTISD